MRAHFCHLIISAVSSVDSDLQNTARPAQIKTNHQTFDMLQASKSAVFLWRPLSNAVAISFAHGLCSLNLDQDRLEPFILQNFLAEFFIFFSFLIRIFIRYRIKRTGKVTLQILSTIYVHSPLLRTFFLLSLPTIHSSHQSLEQML